MAHTANAPMSSPKLGAGSIARRWRELQGSESWKGLLPSDSHPLDADLRASLIAYGELAEAAYDGLNADESSVDAGSPLYKHTGLLAASGFSHPEHYTVTKFLYATADLRWWPWSRSSRSVSKALFVRPPPLQRAGPSYFTTNWIGYVAVATEEGVKALGRRDIVVAWRGTAKFAELAKDVFPLYASAAWWLDLSADDKFANANVHSGFLSVYTTKNPSRNHRASQIDIVSGTSARHEATKEVRRLMEVHKSEETSITVTGHSLGAALATLNAFDIVAHGFNLPPASSKRTCPVTAILFACPRVGNCNFRRVFASLPYLQALHVKNEYDAVPSLPPLFYVDASTATLLIDTNRSHYLRPGNRLTVLWNHNLECYLHGLAGDQGAERDFKLVVDRDLALVNKSTNRLKDKYPVPANWWIATNSKYKVNGVVARFKLENFGEE